MVKPFREQTTGFRIRIGALAPTEPGRVLFENEFFDAQQDRVYKGTRSSSSFYLGTRTEFQLYLGTKDLWN